MLVRPHAAPDLGGAAPVSALEEGATPAFNGRRKWVALIDGVLLNEFRAVLDSIGSHARAPATVAPANSRQAGAEVGGDRPRGLARIQDLYDRLREGRRRS